MKKGFTLIELLIVIAIIAILAGVVFVSLNPTQRFQDARNASRWTDVTAILSAIKVNQVDNGGSYLSPALTTATFPATNYMISADVVAPTSGCNANCSAATSTGACVSLDGLVSGTNAYLGKIPLSPNGSGESWTTGKTGYYMSRNTNGSVTVAACSAEASPTVTVTR